MAEDLKNRVDSTTPAERAKLPAHRDDLDAEDDKEAEDPEDGSLTQMELEAQDGAQKAALPEAPKVAAKAPEAPAKVNDAPPKGDAAREASLKDETATTALLLYAMYRAAKGIVSEKLPSEFAGAIEKIKDSVRHYTGKDPEKLTVLPEENGMRVAVDATGRPVWATKKISNDQNQKLIFDWRADGGLSINIEGPNGFEGRISSRGKIELTKDLKSITSVDNHWLATYPDGNVEKWQGELNFKPGKTSFTWSAGNSNERSEPLKYTADHEADNRKADGMIADSLDRMTTGDAAERAFTSRERAQMKALYQNLMKGDLPGMEEALRDINQKSKSEMRVKQMLDHFVENSGLKNSLGITWSTRGASLEFREGEGNRLVISGNKEQASFAHTDTNTPKLPAQDTFLDLVRAERVARRQLSEKHTSQINGSFEEYEKAEVAKRTLLTGAGTHRELAEPQKDVLRDFEKRFLSGDINGLKKIVQSYDGKPDALKPILEAFTADMRRFSPDFQSDFSISGVDKRTGTFTFGDGKSKVAISTEPGSAVFSAMDAQPELRRSAREIGLDLSKSVIGDTVKKQLEPIPDEPRVPMTGLRDNNGVWNPNYLDALTPEARAQLEERIGKQYELGGHDEMLDFAMRAGRTEEEWNRTNEKYRAGILEESGAFYEMERAKEEYKKARDATLKAIGLDNLPQNRTIPELQKSTTALIGFLKSDEAKAAMIADTVEKVKILEAYQIARQQYSNAGETLKANYDAVEKVKEAFYAELKEGAPLPPGMTKRQVMEDPAVFKEYLTLIDAKVSGIKNAQEKLQALENLEAAQKETEHLRTKVLGPIEAKYFGVRDEVLARLGADKLPFGVTDVALKQNAESLRDFLKSHGQSLGIENLEEKIGSTERFIKSQKVHSEASLKNDAIFEERRSQLEKLTSELAREKGLPPVRLEIANWTKNALGDYLDGRIRVNRQHLSDQNSSVAGTIYHELVHAEQQFKMVRLAADEFVSRENRQPNSSELAQEYKQRVGYSIDKTYAEDCLNARNRKVLNPEERDMAAKLVDAWSKNGSVDGNFSKSAEAYLEAKKIAGDISTYMPADKLIDRYLKSGSIELAQIIPGAQFQAGPNKEKATKLLEELVRDRVAFMNGETPQWDSAKARDKMHDALVARLAAINEWRENDWANYGGPDRKHEYDAQVCGLFFEKEAEKHRAKATEYRAFEEYLQGEKRKWLPEGMQKHDIADGVFFKISNGTEISTPELKGSTVKGVTVINGEIALILTDKNGQVSSNRAAAELMIDKVLSIIGNADEKQKIVNDSFARAEILGRYVQQQSRAELETFFQAAALGSPKNKQIPPSLRSGITDWTDIKEHILSRMPQNMDGHEHLVAKELDSLKAIGDEKLGRAVDQYKEKILEYRFTNTKALVSDLHAGNLPLGMSVPDYIKSKKAEHERVATNFGTPKNSAEISAIFDALNRTGSQREEAIKAAKVKYPESADLWEKLGAVNLESLETRRQNVITSLSNRGFDTKNLNSQRLFNVETMEQALMVIAPGRRLEAPTEREKSTAAPLPFMDPERTALRTSGQDARISGRSRVENIIADARDQLERGAIKNHHDLEATVAEEYLRSALNAKSVNSDVDLYVGGRRAIDPASGLIFTANIGIRLAPNQENYEKKFQEIIGTKGNHESKAIIDGKEITLGKLSYRQEADGTAKLEYRASSDITDKARVEQRKEVLFSELKKLKEQPDSAEKLRQTVRKVAEIEWLSTQSMDYWKGSEDLAQMRSRALLDACGVENGKFKTGVNPAMEAMTSSLSEFVRNYETFFEKPPVSFNKDFASRNDFSRAYKETFSSPDRGKLMDDGSTFYELKEPKKIKLFGIEQTILGVESRDGKTSIISADRAGKPMRDQTLTDALIFQMEASMRSKPVAQGALKSDSKLAANVLTRVLDASTDETINERVRMYEAKTSDAAKNFQIGFYKNTELDTVEKRTLESLKDAITTKQFGNFRRMLAQLDTTEVPSLDSSGKAPSSEFNNVMSALKKDCAIAGLNLNFKTNPDGNGEVRLKSGDLEIVVNTNDHTNFSATRNGVTLKQPEVVDAFADIAETTIKDLHAKLLSTSKPTVGNTVVIPGGDEKPTKFVVIKDEGGTMQLKQVRAEGNPTPPKISAGKIPSTYLTSSTYYRQFEDPTEPGTKLVIDPRNNKTYELGARNPLTWDVDIFERPDISMRSSDFVQRAQVKSVHETLEKTIASSKDVAASSNSYRFPSVMQNVIAPEKMRLYMERVGADAHDNAESVFARAKEFFLQEADQKMETAVRRTKFVEDAALKPGDSRLVFTENGKEFFPKSFSADENGKFVTSDGRTISLKDSRMELRMGKGTDGKDAVREAFKSFQQLKMELDLTASADAENLRKQVRENAHAQHQEIVSEKPNSPEINGKDLVVKIGAFEVAGNSVEVFLTETGIRVGDVEKNNRELVEEAIKNKKEQLQKVKSSEKEKLEREVKELENLHRDIREGKPVELEKMRTAIVENIRSEFEARQNKVHGQAPAKGIIAKASEATGRAGAYLMIAAFVASMMTSESNRQPSKRSYAPLTPLSSGDKK